MSIKDYRLKNSLINVHYSAKELKGITRLAMNAKGDKLTVVVAE